jgi:beta-glucosidase
MRNPLKYDFKIKTKAALILVCGIIGTSALASAPAIDSTLSSDLPWLDAAKPTEERVRLLLEKLTLAEKASLIYWLAPAIDRLGIKEYHHGNESLHGLVRPGKNTSFPQAIALGATFDPDLVQQAAIAISDEARARWNATQGKHLGTYSDVLTLWSPVVNMARDPRWGRTQETYGEDPWLTSRMGVAFVRGLQGDDPFYLKTVSTPKHFAGNNQEWGRFGKNIRCDERYLFEYELFPFRACVEEAKTQSIMASYTAINGVPSSANAWLLNEVLRKRWGFKGYVVSDCGAVSHVVDQHKYVDSPEAAIAAVLNAGLDMEGGYFAKYPDVVNKYLPAALAKGLVNMETVDTAVSRVLTGRFKLGMFDSPERVPYSKIPESVIGSPEHVALARKLARESIVLLKNTPLNGFALLPIDPARVKTIAVVGPNAEVVNLGDYSGEPTRSVTPLQGLRERAQKSDIAVTAYPWQSGMPEVVPSSAFASLAKEGDAGLTGRYFATSEPKGTPIATRVDRALNFDWAHIEPDPLASGTEFSVDWSGTIHFPAPGEYKFIISADGGVELKIGGINVIAKGREKSAKRVDYTGTVHIDTVGARKIELRYKHTGGETGLALRWLTPSEHPYLADLKDADLVVAVMGISTEFETEGKDRKTLNLPTEQEEFLRKAAAINPRLVVVTESGTPLVMSSVSDLLPVLMHAWYPGQEGGAAIADILFGDTNPSARLPITFYADDAQLRPMDEYDITKGRTYLYLEPKPAYAFGHGLSYTHFNYDNLKLSTASAKVGDKITATLNITNTGARDGDEVVQGYVTANQGSVPMPKRQLWAFQRVPVSKGETRSVTLTFDTANFGHWDTARQCFVVEPGEYVIQVGSASDAIHLRATVQLR